MELRAGQISQGVWSQRHYYQLRHSVTLYKETVAMYFKFITCCSSQFIPDDLALLDGSVGNRNSTGLFDRRISLFSEGAYKVENS
jgi:hypothetical protein